ncbi:unnamed protein product [Albugo candida]|uniref:WRKY19-like zinc finger domain-containing protein n=1 Tax=Albugo candida TaxID=65357 RepID=A0A024GEG0_9STRA|nr:unnamed protein product [Albugo candida]|eukprot:CCI45264.1 unnamed protein product [Albugo candida]
MNSLRTHLFDISTTECRRHLPSLEKSLEANLCPDEVMTQSPRAIHKHINHNQLSPREKLRLPSLQSFIDRSKLSQNALDTTPLLSRGRVMRKLGQTKCCRNVQAPYWTSEEAPYQLENILHSVTRLLLRDSKVSLSTNKSKQQNHSVRYCAIIECSKRAKRGGYCIAHGGGLRCSKNECQKHAVTLGLCISHGGGKRCNFTGCMNASRKHGVCWSHGAKRLCKQSGCTKGPKIRGLCWAHGKRSEEAATTV